MTLSADFGIAYGQKQRTLAGSRDATLATNAYSRFLSQQRGTRDLADLDRTQTAGLQQLASGYGHRGLGYSGIYQGAQNDYGQKWLQAQSDITDGMNQSNRQFDLSDASAWSQYNNGSADLELDKQAKIAADAAALAGMQPFL